MKILDYFSSLPNYNKNINIKKSKKNASNFFYSEELIYKYSL